MQIRSDRRYRFALAPEAVWAAVSDVGAYPRWWSWLDDFDGRRLAPGEVWACAVRPPLPYVVRFRLAIDDVDEGRSVSATVEGDIEGRASITLAPAGPAGTDAAAEPGAPAATTVHLRASLAPDKRWLHTLSVLARPVVKRGHDWVLDTGARQFAHAAGPAGRSATPPERGGSRPAAR